MRSTLWPELWITQTSSFGFSCDGLLPKASGVNTLLCFLMDQKVAGSVFLVISEKSSGQTGSKSADELAKSRRVAFYLSSSSISPSFIRAPAERRIVSCQYLIINFHQHCESRMDSLASRVVTPGMSLNGPPKQETEWACVCVLVCVCACVTQPVYVWVSHVCLFEFTVILPLSEALFLHMLTWKIRHLVNRIHTLLRSKLAGAIRFL